MRAAERVRLGRTGIVTTRMGIGTGALGGLYEPVPADAAHACIRRAVELGIRHIDMAPLYGYGDSERRVGEAIRDCERSSIVLSTKVGRPLVDPGPGVPEHDRYLGAGPQRPIFDFSREAILRSVQESCARVGVDRFDVLLVHDPDNHMEAALATAIPLLAELRAAGEVDAIGVGTNDPATAAQLVLEADIDCVLIANRFTLLDQAALVDLLPACERHGVAVIAAGIFNSGLLADPRRCAMFDYEPAPAKMIERALALEAICARYGTPLRAAALQYPLCHPAVRCVLPGCRSSAEVDENVRLLEHEIPREMWLEMVERDLLPAGTPLPGETEEEST